MLPRWSFTIAISAVCLPALAVAGDWTQFRGPDGSAVSEDKGLPSEWAADQNIQWKVKLPGYGWSCPVILGDKVFLTTAVTDRQQRSNGGPGGGGPGGAGGPGGGRGGIGGPGSRGPGGEPGQILPEPVKDRLKLTDEQKKQIEDLQKDADGQLDKLLTDDQKRQLKDMRDNPGRGGAGGFGGRGGFGRTPSAAYKFEVLCLDRKTGETIWNKTAAERKPGISANPSNGYATETPITDGERVYAYFGAIGVVFAFDLDGKPVWSTEIGAHPIMHGTASSPVLADGRLFIQCDNDEKSFLVALDAKNGKELWRTPRTERTTWSTPLVWKNKERTEIVCVGSPRVRSYDPATGKQLWELNGINGQIKASPIADGERLYVGSGGGPGAGGFGGGRGGAGGARPLFAVKAGASGDITLKDSAKSNDGIAWYLPNAGPSTASPLVYHGHLYITEERGGLVCCYDAKTGKQIYKERLSGARGFTSSPWAYDAKIFFLDDEGTTHVIQAGPEFKVLATNALGEMCWSSPAAGGGALLLRTVDHLYCIKEKTAEK
jgi:outer membrane protein assembly factor BamB